MRSKRSWGSSMMSSGSWVLTSSGTGPVMSWVTSGMTSWSRDGDASPPGSRDRSHEGSRLCVVMGSGGGSRDEKSGGSELGRNTTRRTNIHRMRRHRTNPNEEFAPFTFGQRQESTRIPNMEPPKDTTPPIPPQYSTFTKVFSKEASHSFPLSRIWDHTIKLKPGAPSTLPGRLIRLCQAEQQELSKFIQEHLKQKTIRPSKSPYVASFFFIKKKDGSLRPVQDYCPVNQ